MRWGYEPEVSPMAHVHWDLNVGHLTRHHNASAGSFFIQAFKNFSLSRSPVSFPCLFSFSQKTLMQHITNQNGVAITDTQGKKDSKPAPCTWQDNQETLRFLGTQFENSCLLVHNLCFYWKVSWSPYECSKLLACGWLCISAQPNFSSRCFERGKLSFTF